MSDDVGFMVPVGQKKPHIYMLNGEWYSIFYRSGCSRIGPCKTVRELKRND